MQKAAKSVAEESMCKAAEQTNKHFIKLQMTA